MLPACVQCADSTIIIMFWLLPEVLAVTIHGGYAPTNITSVNLILYEPLSSLCGF